MPATAAVTTLRRVHDAAMFAAPPAWLELDQQIAQGLCWWKLVEILQHLRLIGDLQAAGPLVDVDIYICRTPSEVRDIYFEPERRHLSVLREALDRLTDASSKAVVVCLFSYDELDIL